MPGARRRLTAPPRSRSPLSSPWLAGGGGQKPAAPRRRSAGPPAPRSVSRQRSGLRTTKRLDKNLLGRFRDAKGKKKKKTAVERLLLPA